MAQKPFDLAVTDTKKELVDILNSCGLPITTIEMMLREIGIDVQAQSKVIIDQQRAQYEAELIKEQNAENVADINKAVDITPTE